MQEQFDVAAIGWEKHCRNVSYSSFDRDYLSGDSYEELVDLGRPGIPFIFSRWALPAEQSEKEAVVRWNLLVEDIIGYDPIKHDPVPVSPEKIVDIEDAEPEDDMSFIVRRMWTMRPTLKSGEERAKVGQYSYDERNQAWISWWKETGRHIDWAKPLPLPEAFNNAADIWEERYRNVFWHSEAAECLNGESYQTLLALGRPVIPFIFARWAPTGQHDEDWTPALWHRLVETILSDDPPKGEPLPQPLADAKRISEIYKAMNLKSTGEAKSWRDISYEIRGTHERQVADRDVQAWTDWWKKTGHQQDWSPTVLAPDERNALRKQFDVAAAEWEDDCWKVSLNSHASGHLEGSYKKLRNFGRPAIPLVFARWALPDETREKWPPVHWHLLVETIIGDDPVKHVGQANSRNREQAWGVWWKETGQKLDWSSVK